MIGKVQKMKNSLPDGWVEKRLSEIINLIGGGTPKRKMPEYWGGNIPWLSVKEFNNDYRHIDYAEESITKLGLQKSSTKVLKDGQIIISARGTVGALAQLSRPMAFNQSCYGIDAKRDYTDNDFLYYLIKYSLVNLKKITHGAVFDTITRETFNYIKVQLPPLPEQRAIAHILGSLDDKIELNRRINKTLESMAQALFKSWFVDFDPVIDNALAAGKPIPEELKEKAEIRKTLGDTRKPLPEKIRKLFPSEFEHTVEMGWIPKGWRVEALDKIAHFQNGLALQKYRPQKGEKRLPVVKIAQLRSGQPDGDEWASSNIRPDCILDNGDIVFSWSGSLLIKIWNGGRAAMNQHLFKVTSKKYPKWFYYFWTKEHLKEFVRIASDKATTMGHIKRNHLSEAKCLVPDSLLTECSYFFENLLERIIFSELDSKILSSLRDTLLPKLLSGEIRIPEAEKLVGEVE